jgi:hypothetical protein
MKEREVSRLTPYPVCPTLGSNQEMGNPANQGQDARWHQLQDGRFRVRD